MRPALILLALAIAGCAGRFEPPTMRVIRREELPSGSGVRVLAEGARGSVAKATQRALERSGFKVATRKEDTATFVARLTAECRGRLRPGCTYFGLRIVNPSTTEIVGDATMNPLGGPKAGLGAIMDTLIAGLKRTPRQ
jgi:hypothetical protein